MTTHRKHKPITTTQAVAWAGDVRRLAELLRVTVQSIYAWGEYPPVKRQRQIREIFEGQK